MVIFFHGNAELIDFWGSELEKFREWGMGVFLPEFRGYGRSEGFPGQQSISADMHKFYEALIARPDVDPKRIVYFGRSIGTGFACDLSQDHPPAALILMSPFTSLRKMAGRYLAPSFLLKHPLDNEKVVKSSSCPIYIIHGREDTIIPVEHSHRLREVAANCVYREVACGHNDMPMDAEFWQNIHAFLHNNGILEK